MRSDEIVQTAGLSPPIRLIGELNELALNGLVPMFDAANQLFCFRRSETSR